MGDAELQQFLKGQTAVVYAQDPVSVSKTLLDMQKKLNSKDKPNRFKVHAGTLDGVLLDVNGIEQLSKVPSLVVLSRWDWSTRKKKSKHSIKKPSFLRFAN